MNQNTVKELSYRRKLNEESKAINWTDHGIEYIAENGKKTVIPHGAVMRKSSKPLQFLGNRDREEMALIARSLKTEILSWAKQFMTIDSDLPLSELVSLLQDPERISEGLERLAKTRLAEIREHGWHIPNDCDNASDDDLMEDIHDGIGCIALRAKKNLRELLALVKKLPWQALHDEADYSRRHTSLSGSSPILGGN